MAYQVEKYDSRWNEIRMGTGTVLYCANKSTRQIYRAVDGYVSGPVSGFLGENVTSQFKEEEIEELCK